MTLPVRTVRRLAFALLMVTASRAVPDGAAAAIVLDQDLRSHLGSLAPVAVTGRGRATLHDTVVVVSFFASWCPPCRNEFQALNDLAATFPGEALSIVAINVFEAFDADDAPRMARFLADTTPRFDVVKGTAETLARFGAIDRIPTVIVFDRSGRTMLHFVHARGASKMSLGAGELRAAVVAALSD